MQTGRQLSQNSKTLVCLLAQGGLDGAEPVGVQQ